MQIVTDWYIARNFELMATAKVQVLRTHFNRNLCPWLMESDVGRDTNKSLWVLGRYGYIAEDWKSLEQSSILWTPTVVLAYLTKVCEHLKRTNKAMSSRLYVAT